MAIKIGDYVITTKKHSCLARTFAKGTRVKVTGCDDMRGFTIENSKGEKIAEIGWEI
jgi:hypothetical protein